MVGHDFKDKLVVISNIENYLEENNGANSKVEIRNQENEIVDIYTMKLERKNKRTYISDLMKNGVAIKNKEAYPFALKLAKMEYEFELQYLWGVE